MVRPRRNSTSQRSCVADFTRCSSEVPMLLRNRIHSEIAADRRHLGLAGAMTLAVLANLLFVSPAAAALLDFGAALQPLPAGTPLTEVLPDDGGWMNVHVRNHGGGPDLCIVYDSANPTGGDTDLGTPNDDFGGPGDGRGGEEGEEGENAVALGKIIIIAEDDEDSDDDGLVDEPDDESGGGIVWLEFSHAGRLTLTLIDVDGDEEEPRLYLFKEGELVGCAEGDNPGDNSAQTLDLSEYGDIDAVRIHLDGSTGIGGILLDVPQVGVESATWSGIKGMFR
jgi:hypothetical protein